MVKEEMERCSIKTSSAGIRAWFDLRRRYVSNWLFMFHRLTGIALTIYLLLHVKTVSQLTEGGEIYNSVIREFETFSWFVILLLVITAGIFHGLNGIRLVLYQFGFGTRHQKTLSIIVIALTTAATVLVAYFLLVQMVW